MIARLTVVAAAALLLAPASAFADWCETFPGSGKFTDQNCDKPYDTSGRGTKAGAQQPPRTQQPKLRDTIRAKLNEAGKQAPQTPAGERWIDAARRADEALGSAQLATDPQERAAIKRKYDEAMREARQAGKEHIDSLKDPAQRAHAEQAMKDFESNSAIVAGKVGIAATAPPTQTAAAPPPPPSAASPQALTKVFTICEQPERGVTTCYEIPPSGNQCLKVYYQGGERTWADSRTNACSAEDLRQRDDYYAGKAVGTGPVPDARSRQIEGFMASLSPRCQQDLRNFMLNSRDSNATKAMDSYRSVSSDRECRAGMEKLAGILGVALPQRRLAEADRQAWTGAMTDRPRETVSVPETYSQTPGTGWNVDTGEVIQAGIILLDFLGAVLGVAAGVAAYNSGGGGGTYYAPAPAGNYGGPTGGGYVYRGNNRGSNSTITGGSR